MTPSWHFLRRFATTRDAAPTAMERHGACAPLRSGRSAPRHSYRANGTPTRRACANRLARSLVPRAVATTLLLIGPVTADEIQSRGRTFTNAKIVGMDQGHLRFRSADGSLQTLWVDEIELISVDRGGMFADFNEAERLLAGGEFEKSLNRYRRVLRLTEDFWQDLVPARMLMAADRGGQIDAAADGLVRIVRGRWGGPALAVRLLPNNLPDKPNAKAARALESLDSALGREGKEDLRVPLVLARYELLRAIGDGRSPAEAQRVAATAVPETQRCDRAFRAILDALRQSEQLAPQATALQNLDRAIGTCPETVLPGFLILKGQILSKSARTPDEWIRASWPLLRVGIHFPDHPLAAEGWLGAARSLNQLGRTEQAIDLLKECIAVRRVAEPVRTQAEAMLRELQAGSTGKDTLRR